jgi:MFS family permease
VSVFAMRARLFSLFPIADEVCPPLATLIVIAHIFPGAISMSQIHHSPSGADAADVSANTRGPAEATPAGRLPSLWRNHDFMLLWSGQLISSIGSQISLLSFPLLILAMTHSPAQAGIVGALRSLPFAILCLPAGALVDRWDRKKVMLLCDTGRAIALGSIPLALWLGRLSIIQLCLVALVEGTLMAFFSLADAACLPHVVPKEQLPAATAQNQAIDSISWTLGPFLGGLLYGLGRSIPDGRAFLHLLRTGPAVYARALPG